jgi:hypothetical protein
MKYPEFYNPSLALLKTEATGEECPYIQFDETVYSTKRAWNETKRKKALGTWSLQ